MSNIHLGKPSAKLKKWCEDHYGKKDSGPLCFTALEPNSTVALLGTYNTLSVNLQYSTDNCTTWNDYLESGAVLSLDLCEDNKVFMKAKTENLSGFGTATDGHYFSLTGKIAASGSVQYLLKNDGKITSVPPYAFSELFSECSALVSPPEFPATQLAEMCYFCTLAWCENLSTSPILPATKLATQCYDLMFGGCTSLSSAPDLPASALADGCYQFMFIGCTSLSSAPTLSANKLAKWCYAHMFNGCSSLKVSEDKENGIAFLSLSSGTTTFDQWNEQMFFGTGGEFTANPVVGKTYRYY